MSSCSPEGKLATSSTSSSAQLVLGIQTLPLANISDTAFNLAILSLPRVGVNSCTGIPIALNSEMSGAPEAFASTISASGSHSLYSL